MELSTRIIHEDNIKDNSGAVMAPIVLSTTFERAEDGISYPEGYIYSRYDKILVILYLNKVDLGGLLFIGINY